MASVCYIFLLSTTWSENINNEGWALKKKEVILEMSLPTKRK